MKCQKLIEFDCVLYKFRYNDSDCYCSKHLSQERLKRNDYILKHFNLSNKYIMNVFCVDRGHKDGIELHVIYKSGVIKIINPLNRRIVSYLIARPQQIRRYYQKCHLRLQDQGILKIAYINSLEHLNTI